MKDNSSSLLFLMSCLFCCNPFQIAFVVCVQKRKKEEEKKKRGIEREKRETKKEKKRDKKGEKIGRIESQKRKKTERERESLERGKRENRGDTPSRKYDSWFGGEKKCSVFENTKCVFKEMRTM
jgi:hypothetical protein